MPAGQNDRRQDNCSILAKSAQLFHQWVWKRTLNDMTEKLEYRVVEKFDQFEVREYSPFWLIEIDQPGDWLRAGNMAFRPLVGYISGENVQRQKYAMTAPVIQTAPELQTNPSAQAAAHSATPGTHTVAFVLPASARGEVPVATDSRIRVIQNPGGLFAAAKFRGGWSEALFSQRAAELVQNAKHANLEIIGEPLTARYDGPWKPGFAKHNEVLVRIAR